MKTIILSRGYATQVDEDDFEWLSLFSWHLHTGSTGGKYAAAIDSTLPRKDRVPILLHRVLTLARQGESVDHINGDSLDNRSTNLRICSHAQNMQNCKPYATNTSGFTGVWKKRRRFCVTISSGNRSVYVGTFDTALQAAIARDGYVKQLRGEFARLNFKS